LAIGDINAIKLSMAQLIVRNIDKVLVDLLKRRAAEHGRSAEAEHREILRVALQPRPEASLKDHLLAMPNVGEDSDFVIKRARARRVTL
jgi:plasmid stability protein